MKRREYPARLTINGRKITKVVIDPHYEEQHSESISDDIILQIVQQLDGEEFEAEARDEKFEYFVTDDMLFDGKLYKLIWLLEDDELYIGIVNCYRRRK